MKSLIVLFVVCVYYAWADEGNNVPFKHVDVVNVLTAISLLGMNVRDNLLLFVEDNCNDVMATLA